jgi:hypothetical protein
VVHAVSSAPVVAALVHLPAEQSVQLEGLSVPLLLYLPATQFAADTVLKLQSNNRRKMESEYSFITVVEV